MVLVAHKTECVAPLELVLAQTAVGLRRRKAAAGKRARVAQH